MCVCVCSCVCGNISLASPVVLFSFFGYSFGLRLVILSVHVVMLIPFMCSLLSKGVISFFNQFPIVKDSYEARGGFFFQRL